MDVPVITSAVVPLLSSIIGGVLVLAGQYWTRRYEDRRAWLTRLHEAAGDLATSYLQEAAAINDSRRSGERPDEVSATTYVVDRQKAFGRFSTLPWALLIQDERRAMGRKIESLWNAWGDPDDKFQRAYDELRSAVAVFTEAVGQLLVDPPATRRRRSPRQ